VVPAVVPAEKPPEPAGETPDRRLRGALPAQRRVAPPAVRSRCGRTPRSGSRRAPVRARAGAPARASGRPRRRHPRRAADGRAQAAARTGPHPARPPRAGSRTRARASRSRPRQGPCAARRSSPGRPSRLSREASRPTGRRSASRPTRAPRHGAGEPRAASVAAALRAVARARPWSRRAAQECRTPCGERNSLARRAHESLGGVCRLSQAVALPLTGLLGLRHDHAHFHAPVWRRSKDGRVAPARSLGRRYVATHLIPNGGHVVGIRPRECPRPHSSAKPTLYRVRR
jgi:hypothetical protein